MWMQRATMTALQISRSWRSISERQKGMKTNPRCPTSTTKWIPTRPSWMRSWTAGWILHQTSKSRLHVPFLLQVKEGKPTFACGCSRRPLCKRVRFSLPEDDKAEFQNSPTTSTTSRRASPSNAKTKHPPQQEITHAQCSTSQSECPKDAEPSPQEMWSIPIQRCSQCLTVNLFRCLNSTSSSGRLLKSDRLHLPTV